MPTLKPSNLVGFHSLACVKSEKKLHYTHTKKQKQTNNSSRNTKKHPSKISKIMPDSCGKSALPPDVSLSMKNVRAEEGGKETTGKTSLLTKGLGERRF